MVVVIIIKGLSLEEFHDGNCIYIFTVVQVLESEMCIETSSSESD